VTTARSVPTAFGLRNSSFLRAWCGGGALSTVHHCRCGNHSRFFLEVYCGHLPKHVTKASGDVGGHSTIETVVTVLGFLGCVAVMVYICRMAKKAIADAGALE
jgi:hypothetical protein